MLVCLDKTGQRELGKRGATKGEDLNFTSNTQVKKINKNPGVEVYIYNLEKVEVDRCPGINGQPA